MHSGVVLPYLQHCLAHHPAGFNSTETTCCVGGGGYSRRSHHASERNASSFGTFRWQVALGEKLSTLSGLVYFTETDRVVYSCYSLRPTPARVF